MPNEFQRAVDASGVLILDGALATELERRGADLDHDLWSARLLLENPNLIEQVHYDYFVAGADIAITTSYQATFPGLANLGLTGEKAADVLRLSVDLARRARDRFWDDEDHRLGRIKPLVAASVGSYGAYLADGSEYRGDYGLSKYELMSFHRARMEVLVASGADVIACETVPCLVEGEALAGLLTEFVGVDAWLSFSCRDGRHVCHGEPFAECVALANDCGALRAVGVNCTAPEHMSSLIKDARAMTNKAIVAYPNSGEGWDAERQCWAGNEQTGDIAEMAKEWYRLGARIIGGCCRTTPETIRAIRAALHPLPAR